jgi:hypothetical protein
MFLEQVGATCSRATGSRRVVRSAMRDAAPDPLERLARLAVRDLDRVETHLTPILEELLQIGVGEEVHRLACLLEHVVFLEFPCDWAPALPERAVFERVHVK